MRLRRLAGGLFAVGLLASVSAFPATAGTLVAPAASIAGPNGRFVGGAVHNDTGAGQTVAFVIPSGSDRHGYVRIRNNGSSTQTFLLHGPAGRGPFRLRYATFEDVTAEVVRGTFSMTLARGDSGYVEFTAGAAPDSRAGQSEAFRFRATNRDDPILFDVVRTKIAVGPVSSWAVNFRGTLRCNASVPSATLHPGYDTHAVLTLTNLTDRAVRPHIGFGYLEFFDGSGHKLWDSAPRFEGPRPTVGEVGPHETVPLYVYDTRVRWSGPLLVRPVCQGLDAKVPGLPMRVAAPGAPATLADAIDAAVGLPNSPFQACHPGPGGEPATGEFPAPDGRPIPPASLRCWADVRQEDGFDVVALNMVSPSDGPDYTIDESSFVFGPPQLPGDQS
ncbi:MAG TPA: hypothetical protein VNN79_26205, partial [Actinomycetota bacterium]|nr:hypothetical protein [Actinomycetota bacterium]